MSVINNGTRAVAIGNFDGVHLGHQRMLQAERGDGELAAIASWPHPLSVLAPEHAPRLLSDLPARIDLLKRTGAREVRVVRFDKKMAAMSPTEFVKRFVVPLAPRVVVVGENFRFRYRASGDVGTPGKLAAGRFEVRTLELSAVNARATCSTLIRETLDRDDTRLTSQHLGRDFRFSGIVVVGSQRGRELGSPTANLVVPAELTVPTDGVCTGWLTPAGGKPMPAAISMGSNPTFGGAGRRVESNVLDHSDLGLYRAQVDVDFVEKLREQVRFGGVEGLIAQMSQDIENYRRVLTWRS